ncbi:MAG: RNA methyltransferase [Proteobacteria bacterium]|nr:RNA methyltransferase [Pseudomonadota bacterium]
MRELRSLSSTKIRRNKGVCLVEGERALREAASRGVLRYLIASAEETGGREDPRADPGLSTVPLYLVDRRIFRELSDIRSGTGLIGVADIPPAADFQILPGEETGSVLLFLDGLQEPGNVGGIIRTGWALGIRGAMLGPGTADPFAPKGGRASAGGVFHLPLFYPVSREHLETLQDYGYSIYLAESRGAPVETVRFSCRSVLILGNEGRGASEGMERLGIKVAIPMAEGVDSLNVVVAGSMILAAMTEGRERTGRMKDEGGRKEEGRRKKEEGKTA